MQLGSKLKQLRIRKKQSLQEVADAIGVSKAYVWQLERDEEVNPSAEVLKRIADHFQTTVAALVGESPDHENDQQMMRMFRNLGELSPNDRAVIEEMIKALRRRASPDEN